MERFHRFAPKALSRALSTALPSAALAALSTFATVPVSAGEVQIPHPHRHNPHVLMALPSANILGHYQFMLSGRFQYFNTSASSVSGSDSGTLSEASHLTYDSELLLGIENRAEIGVQYGHDLALSIKALLVREDVFWPDLVFGIRGILGSPEGGLYAVEDEDVLQSLNGESYVTLAKTFPSGSRIHFGLSYLNRAEKGNIGVNAGLEQDLGAGAYLGYEVFERFSDFHQVLSLNWRFRDIVAFSLGLTEFQSWIRQNGEWGFFHSPGKETPTGYNSPGITFSLQVLGFMPKRQKRTLPERVAIMEVRHAEMEKRLAEMQQALAMAEARAEEAGESHAADPSPAAGADAEAQVRALLQGAADQMALEIPNPEAVRKIMFTLVTMGPPAAEALRAAAADRAAESLRIPALLTMAFSRDSSHAPALRSLLADPDARIRREALTALIKVRPQGALEDARRLMADPDETVALAAGEAYRLLGGEPFPGSSAPAAKSAPAVKGAPPAKTAPSANPAAKPPAKASAKGSKSSAP